MQVQKIQLHSVEEVSQFVHEANQMPFSMDLVSGRYVTNAKSIMGIFSMDLSETLELRIYTDDPDALEKIRPFLA